MANLKWDSKDPDEVIDYKIDWSARLNPDNDTIQSSTWIVPSGITKNSDSIAGASKITVIWLSSGTLGSKYTLTNRIITVGGRTYDQSVDIKIQAK